MHRHRSDMKFVLVAPFLCRGEYVCFHRVYDHVPNQKDLPLGVDIDDGLYTITFDNENKVVKWITLQLTDCSYMDIIRDFKDEDDNWDFTIDITVDGSLDL